MSRTRLYLNEPHAGQQAVIDGAARFNVVVCGRRWGKTALGINRAVGTLLAQQPVAWFSPTYKMLSDVWRELRNTLQPITERVSTQEHRIETMGGGLLDMWSLDNPDAPRGRKYARVIVDEAAMVPALQEAWEQVIRPTLTDYRGDAWFLSTPKGRNYYYTLYQRGQSADHPDWASWHQPTAANPYIIPAEIEAARKELPEMVYAQEYLATFLDNEGAVFRRVRGCVDRTLPCEPYEGAFIMGLDWGRENDYTVATVIDMVTRRVVAVDRFNKIDWAYQRERIKTLFRRWRCQVIVAEHNSIGGPNIEALVADDIPVFPFVTTNASKAVAIERLVLAIENGTIAYPDDAVLIGELEAFEMSRTRLGTVTYGAPEGGHDDCVMSLALAVWGCN